MIFVINFVFFYLFFFFPGYNLGYQPAGPLISPHILQPQPQGPKTIPPTIDSDGRPQQQPQSSGAAGDSDNDVLITGKITYVIVFIKNLNEYA